MTTTTEDATTVVSKLKELHGTMTPAQQSLLTYVLETARTSGTTTDTTPDVTGYTATESTWTGLTSWLTTTTSTTSTSTSTTTTTDA